METINIPLTQEERDRHFYDAGARSVRRTRVAVISNGGNSLEIDLTPRGVRVVLHSDDGTSREARFNAHQSLDFLAEILGDYSEMARTWINQSAPRTDD